MDLNCPKCQSENTQKITAIVDSGTTHSRGTTTTVGMGSVGGRMAFGSSTGTTKTTHKTALAQKFPTPRKRSEGYVFSSLVLTAIISAVILGFFGVNSEFFFVIEAIACFGLVGNWMFKRGKKKSEENKTYNQTVFQQELNVWENGFYCHRCEAVFVPQ